MVGVNKGAYPCPSRPGDGSVELDIAEALSHVVTMHLPKLPPTTKQVALSD